MTVTRNYTGRDDSDDRREHEIELDTGDDKLQNTTQDVTSKRSGAAARQAEAESPDDGFPRPKRDVDVVTTEVLLLSLLECAIQALYNQVYEQNNRTKR